jgi:CheY-like chemotaxis protein
VVLTVTDTGAGMDAYTLAHLFEPFFTTKGAGRGTGLGLSTVYGIVTQSGGRITVTSEPGRGARFEVWFPRVATPSLAAEAGAIEASVADGGPETVLLVEDDDAVRAGIKAALAGAGHHVVEAADGHDALSRLEIAPHAIELLVTDLVMPMMSGRELARRARTLHPELPVLFISGYAPPGDLRFGPGETFLPKPFEAATLLRTVRQVLDASADRRATRPAG